MCYVVPDAIRLLLCYMHVVLNIGLVIFTLVNFSIFYIIVIIVSIAIILHCYVHSVIILYIFI